MTSTSLLLASPEFLWIQFQSSALQLSPSCWYRCRENCLVISAAICYIYDRFLSEKDIMEESKIKDGYLMLGLNKIVNGPEAMIFDNLRNVCVFWITSFVIIRFGNWFWGKLKSRRKRSTIKMKNSVCRGSLRYFNPIWSRDTSIYERSLIWWKRQRI